MKTPLRHGLNVRVPAQTTGYPSLRFVIVAVNIVLLLILFSTSLYAGNGLAVTPFLHSEIFNMKEGGDAGYPNRDAWLRLASIDNGDKRDCQNKASRENCRPLKKLEVKNLYSLQFGKVVMNRGFPGTVTIDPASGKKTVTGAYDGGGRHGPAEFEIIGEPEQKFVVNFPQEMTLSGRNGRGSRITEVTWFLAEKGTGNGDSRAIGTLGKDGKAVLQVGGTLNISPNHGHGERSGRWNVFVEYLP